MENLGRFLKREREFRGLTLNQLSQATKIGLPVLKNLEEDRFEKLPQPTFLRGFLKSYARAVGLREEEVLARYRGQGSQPTGAENPLKDLKPIRKRERIGWIILILAIVIILATFLSTR